MSASASASASARPGERASPEDDAFVQVGGVSLRTRRVGARAGADRPLLLINGIGAALEMLAPLAERLPGREVIMVDLPGCGRSELPRVPLRMRGIADVVAGVLDALEVDRADVLGYSFGGAVAQELAFRHPERVGRLLLCGTTPGVPAVPPGPIVSAMMMTPARYYSRGLGELFVPRIVGGRSARDRDVLRAGLEERQKHPPGLLGYSYQLLAITGWTSQWYLHRIRARTLVLHGDDDPVAPLVNARLLAWRIPGARLRVIRGGGHLFLLDEPRRAVRHVEAFLT